jgi:hypothetical protein
MNGSLHTCSYDLHHNPAQGKAARESVALSLKWTSETNMFKFPKGADLEWREITQKELKYCLILFYFIFYKKYWINNNKEKQREHESGQYPIWYIRQLTVTRKKNTLFHTYSDSNYILLSIDVTLIILYTHDFQNSSWIDFHSRIGTFFRKKVSFSYGQI